MNHKKLLISSFLLSCGALYSEERHLDSVVFFTQNEESGEDIISSSPLFTYREPIEQDVSKWNLFGEYLYWNVVQNTLYYVLAPDIQIAPDLQETPALSGGPQGRYHLAKLDWHSGFRTGVQYTFKRDSWRFLGQYTYYSSEGRDKVIKSSDPRTVMNGNLMDVSFTGLKRTFTDINFHYNIGDLLLSRRFVYSDQIIFSFATGLTGAWIEQNWHVAYLDTINDFIKNNWNLEAGGLKTEIDFDWHFGKGFGLVNSLSLSGLLGKYTNRNRLSLEPIERASTAHFVNPFRNTTYKATNIYPTMQFTLGLEWGHVYHSFATRVLLAGESNIWFNLHRTFRSKGSYFVSSDKIPVVDRSDLILYGLSARVDFDF